MSGRLVGDVVRWLLTPAARSLGLTSAECAVLYVIAERANEVTGEMWRHRDDTMNLYDRVAIAAGTPTGLKDVLERLARRGLEVRIPIASGRDGRPVFAARGRPMRFRLPDFPASVQLPDRSGENRPYLPDVSVDNPPSESVDNPVSADGKGRSAPRLSTERGGEHRPNRPERGGQDRPLIPSKRSTSKTSPSTPGVPDVRRTVEDRPAVHREPSAQDQKFRQPPILLAVPDPDPREYGAARDRLALLPDYGQAAMAAARAELPTGTPLAQLVIHAADLAWRTA